MNQIQRHFSKFFVLIFGFLCLVGCTIDLGFFEYRQAESAAEKSQYDKAVKYYKKVIRRSPDSPEALKSARSAARISVYELRNFNLAIEFFEFITNHAETSSERRLAQKELADLVFEKKNDYPRAIIEYNKLLSLGVSREEALRHKLRIAKSHFYISEFFQAESETKDALRAADKGAERFELELFLANILQNTRRVEEASAAYRKIMAEYPELSRKEKVHMSLVVSLEESERFSDAISVLKSLGDSADDPEFVRLKIGKLEERIKNMPGARGLRK